MSKLPYTVAFLSSQGGSGKTTVCVNTAAELSNMGKNVLLVDTYSDALFYLGLDRDRQPFPGTIQNSNFARYSKNLSIYKTSCHSGLFIEGLFDYITMRRKRYDYIFIDLNGGPLNPTPTVLAKANRAIVTFRGGDISRNMPLGTSLTDISKARYNGNIALDVDFIVTKVREISDQIKRWREFFNEHGAFTFPFYTADTTYEDEAIVQSKAFAELRRDHRNAQAYRRIAEKLFSCTPPKPQRAALSRKKYRQLLNDKMNV